MPGSPIDNSAPGDGLPVRWEWLFRWFRWYSRRYVRRNFHAVRLARLPAQDGCVPSLPAGPVMVVMNHPAWWDPLVGLVLSDRIGRTAHHAPIDAKALGKYSFFTKLGFFGIDPDTVAGARAFLRTGAAVLSNADAALWVTGQGRFTDARVRPPGLKSGVGHLAARVAARVVAPAADGPLDGTVEKSGTRAAAGCVLPLAVEYPFWNERYPEALAAFGRPVPLRPDADGTMPSADAWTARIESALAETQDRLAGLAIRRDPAGFETVIGGAAGVGGVYGWWQWLKARLSGRAWRGEHDDGPRRQPAAGPSAGLIGPGAGTDGGATGAREP